jgi:hypothetical protein
MYIRMYSIACYCSAISIVIVYLGGGSGVVGYGSIVNRAA